MNARKRGAFGIASAMVLLFASVLATQNRSDDVEQVIADFLVPFSNGNVAGFIEYFADDATVFMPPTAPGASAGRVQGKAGIAREFEALFARVRTIPGAQGAPTALRPTIRPLDVNVQRFDNFAVVTFHLGTDAARGRRTFVLRRTDLGWKIVHLHASTFPVQ